MNLKTNMTRRPERKERITKHPYIGTKVGQYEVTDLLGGGAMGLVFKAYQSSVNRDIAIKFLSYDLRKDELSRKRLEREAQAMGKLKHPGLVSTYEFGISDFGQPFITMEYVEGKPLSEILGTEGPLSVNRAIHFFIQIADAMEYAHRHGVIHRDLKPANIMITQEPWQDFLKIFDFGIARLTADSQMLTCPGEVLGSPVYMSPEQCKGENIDKRSDIYTLGVIMYFCLTGQFPVIGTDGRTTMLLKTRNQPIPISNSCPDLAIHASLDALIMKMLNVDAALRPQDMIEVKEELEQIAKIEALALPQSNIQSHSGSGKRLNTKGLTNSDQEDDPANKSQSQDVIYKGLLAMLATFVLALAYSSDLTSLIRDNHANSKESNIVGIDLAHLQAEQPQTEADRIKNTTSSILSAKTKNGSDSPSTTANNQITPIAKGKTKKGSDLAPHRQPSKSKISSKKRSTVIGATALSHNKQNNDFHLAQTEAQAQVEAEVKVNTKTIPTRKSESAQYRFANQTITNPLAKLNNLPPEEREKLKLEIISFMERKRKMKMNGHNPRQNQMRKPRISNSPNNQTSQRRIYGNSPYNQIHYF